MPFVDMFEQESGQLLIDRRRHAAPLELLHFPPTEPVREAQTCVGRQGFVPLGVVEDGDAVPYDPEPSGRGRQVDWHFVLRVQHDAAGQVLFLHRNSHKLTGGRTRNPADEKLKTLRQEREVETHADDVLHVDNGNSDDYPDTAVWTHLFSFRSSSPRSKYTISTYHAQPEFSKDQICYGQRTGVCRLEVLGTGDVDRRPPLTAQ